MTSREGSLDAPTRHPIRVARCGVHRRRRARQGDAAGLRHLSWLPALLQSVRFVSAPVRPDRLQAERRRRRREVGGFRDRRRSLHALRHVLHDEVPLRAAASVQSGFSASDAARPRRGGETGQDRFHAAPTGRDGPQRPPGAVRGAGHQLGVAPRQQADAAGDGSRRRHRPHGRAAEIPYADVRLGRHAAIRSVPTRRRPPSASARRRSMPPASSTTTSRRRAWRRARCSITSASRPRSPIPAAAACRSWNRPSWSASRRTRRRFPRNSSS